MPEFKVKDLSPRLGQVNIVLDVVSLGEPRAFNSYKGQGTVANAAGKDETGEVSITLWNDQYKLIKQGDKIKIENGYVSEYNGKLQISTGKFGTITVLEQGKEESAEESEE